MPRCAMFFLVILGLLFPAAAQASDPTGVFAIVESVTFEPSKTAPERVRVHGAFSFAAGKHGSYYTAPLWGQVYFKLPAKKQDVVRTEWADLELVAGTSYVVAFGSRYQMFEDGGVTLHDQDARPEKADPYPTGWGLQKLTSVRSYAVARLLSLPKPAGPDTIEVDGEVRRPGTTVELVARNPVTRTEDTRVVFEVELSGGQIFSSPALKPGEKDTRWKVFIKPSPGEVVRWRVRIIDPTLKHFATASATITVKGKTRTKNLRPEGRR